MCMQSGLYADHLPGLVSAGEVEESAVDRSVLRVLRAKQALGLFDDPYRGLGRAFDPAPARELAREAARRCQVLLKNRDGVLPLKTGTRVALIGPFAREHQHLNGAWAIFAANGASVNLEDGFLAALGPEALIVEPGCGIAEPIPGGLDHAVAAARAADVVLLALGEGQHMSGESRSRSDIGLPSAQLDLARAVKQAGKPIVTLLRSGRPLAVPELAKLSDALLVTWFLGAETGAAVADVVLGRAAPSGRLPMSFPRRVGQAPIYYARKPTGRPPREPPGPFTARYIDEEPTPLYPFGYGLGYGRIEYGPTRVSVAELGWAGMLRVSCELVETAGAAIEEVVQLYIRDVAASRVRPVRELKDFRKVAIAAGARVVVDFDLHTPDLRFTGADGATIVEPGAFDVWIAPHAEAGIAARFVLVDRRSTEPPDIG
jgi:beta-glucosidase